MRLRRIKNLRNLKGKKVVVRVDFNVPIKNGRVIDDFRIKRTLPTLRYLKDKRAKIILISHLSKNNSGSLEPVAKYLKIKFLPDVLGDDVRDKLNSLRECEMVLFENLRIHPEEEKNSLSFAKKLAELGDIFVNDAFSVSHRKHASVVGITKYLPSYAGLLFEEEFKNLSSAFKPKHPFLLILGGIKFKTKLGVLNRFIKIADKIFVGGALANNFFREEGRDVGKSIIDEEVDIKKFVGHPKIVLPIDVRKKNGMILDCGPKTIEILSDLIKKSKFILWNGPLGDFERRGFGVGTFEIAKAIARSPAKSIIGGGDTISAVRQAGGDKLLNKFSFVSTGGGAMLEFLSKGMLPGIKPLLRE